MSNNYKELKIQFGKNLYFPNNGIAAYCDLRSQLIHLNGLSKVDFDAALQMEIATDLRNHLGTMLHEITHWADIVGTLWGQEYLRAVYDALALLKKTTVNGGEQEFYKFIDLHDRTRRIMMSQYYRTTTSKPPPHDHRRTWGIQFSAGSEFDVQGRLDPMRPIVFGRFLDRATDALIARQPIVVGALLETNAVWSEISTNIEILRRMQQPERAFEEAAFKRQQLCNLYDPDLTIYTAPVHLLAQFAAVFDSVVAYELASAVSHIVLNLKPDDFFRMKLPDSMRPWEKFSAGFRKERNHGFAYTVICGSCPKWRDNTTVEDWLNDTLKIAGLGPASSIFESAQSEMQSNLRKEQGLQLVDPERYLLELGEHVLKVRSCESTALTPSRIEQANLATPPMFDAEGELIFLKPTIFDVSRFSPKEMYEASWELEKWTQNLLGACR